MYLYVWRSSVPRRWADRAWRTPPQPRLRRWPRGRFSVPLRLLSNLRNKKHGWDQMWPAVLCSEVPALRCLLCWCLGLLSCSLETVYTQARNRTLQSESPSFKFTQKSFEHFRTLFIFSPTTVSRDSFLQPVTSAFNAQTWALNFGEKKNCDWYPSN